MIELKHYAKRYGAFQAVYPLDLTVPTGQVFALLGHNGAGKTTIIKSITGLSRPSGGEVWVDGINVWKDSVRAKNRIGYIPDRPYLYAKLTPRELLRFVAGVYRLGKIDASIETWLEFFELAEFGNALIETFSHGMKQKLTFIAAIIHQPPVLVVDEPMVGLDPRAAKQVRELMKSYAEKGNTVLLTTHSMPLAEAIAETIAVLDHGKQIALGDMASLKQQTQGTDLEEVFFRLLEEERKLNAAPHPWGDA
ncbi:MAG: ABC transporter ATP-binding protein [Deinococcaceae bacterium]